MAATDDSKHDEPASQQRLWFVRNLLSVFWEVFEDWSSFNLLVDKTPSCYDFFFLILRPKVNTAGFHHRVHTCGRVFRL